MTLKKRIKFGKTGKTPSILRALEYRNYRIFFVGQGISAAGTWAQNIAMSWLIYRMTDSAWMLGMIAFTSQFPNFVLAPIAGVMVDRWVKRRVLIVTQFLSLLQAAVLTVLTLSAKIEIWQLLALSLFLGCVNAFDVPARHAITVELVDKKEDKNNAIALNSVMYNIARLLGPSLAGLIIPYVGEGMCFLINTVSYFIAIVSLWLLRLKQLKLVVKATNAWQGFKEGYRYTFGQLPLRLILTLLAIVSLMAMPYTVLLPILVSQQLNSGAGTLGLLMAASGVGSLLGAFYLASRPTFQGLDKLLAAASTLIGVGLVIFSVSKLLLLSVIMMFVLGLGLIVQIVGSNTLLQSMVDNALRGRVMSFYTMVFMGIGPIGSLLAGTLANKIGAVKTLVFGGMCCVAAAYYFYRHISVFRVQACPIFVQTGNLNSPDECRF